MCILLVTKSEQIAPGDRNRAFIFLFESFDLLGVFQQPELCENMLSV
jgi:hypothetical protein